MRDITLGDTFYHDFTTRQFSDGVPTTLAGTPVLSVLEENNATPITSGVSVSVDRASVTGLNEATIVATGGNGFESGKSYSIYISTGTVGGTSVVGEVVGQFTVEASAAAVDLANGTDGLTALKTAIDGVPTTAEFEARTRLDADYFSWATDDVAVVTLVNTLTTYTGDTPQTADHTAGIADIPTTAEFELRTILSASYALETTLDGLITTVGVAGAGLTDITLNAASIDLVWDENISKANHNATQSAAKFLRQGADLVQIDGAVSDVSPTATDFDTDLTQVDGYFEDAVLIFSNGSANAGIGKPVSAYLNANGNMTFLAPDIWPVTPVNGDDFVIFANHVHPIAQIQSAILSDATPFQGADIAAILTAVDTDIPATLVTIEGKIDIIDTNLDDVKITTDKFVFTVTNQVDSNIKYVNDQIVTGDGGVGTEWQGA